MQTEKKTLKTLHQHKHAPAQTCSVRGQDKDGVSSTLVVTQKRKTASPAADPKGPNVQLELCNVLKLERTTTTLRATVCV